MSAQSLLEAVAKRLPIKAVWQGDERIVSHIYITRDGQRLIWGEPNWLTSADTQGVHLIEGAVTGDDPWRAGETEFIEMDEQDDLQYLHTSMALLEEEQGHDYEKAVQILSKAF
jgi:hypothetical protein